MTRTVSAARPVSKYIPAFTVTKLEGEFEQTQARMVPYGIPNKDGIQKHRLEFHKVMLPKGYLVTTPPCQAGYNRNGSVHISTLEELEKNRFTNTEVPLVDDDGEVVGVVPNRVLKAKGKEQVNA